MTECKQYLEDWKVAGKSSKEKDDKGQCDELQKDDQREPGEWMSAAVWATTLLMIWKKAYINEISSWC